MNYAEIKYFDIANGAGVRTSLFVSGCRHRCPGCFNASAWDFAAGKPFDDAVAEKVLASLEPDYVSGLSLLGGEPMEPENQGAIAKLLERMGERAPQKDVWLYSGFRWEELLEGPSRAHTQEALRILSHVAVLVDGPFVESEKDISLRFRGSANQRVIDVPRSLAEGRVLPWQDDPVFVGHTW